jgi:hypothetical protein
MAWHDYIHIHFQDFVYPLHPLRNVTIVRVWHQVKESQIRREQNFVLRQKSHQISPCMRRRHITGRGCASGFLVSCGVVARQR